MPDTITLIAGAVLWLTGFAAGHFSTRAKSLPTPTCGCGHPLALHDQEARCHGENSRKRYDSVGNETGLEWVPCPCRQFT